MTDAEKIIQLKALLGNQVGDDWSDDVLLAYLLLAGEKIINRAYPYAKDEVLTVPRRYELLQCEIATYLLNKRGAEGEISHSENGISRGYESSDVPESMLANIVPFCCVV
jgi:hypothetical protein